MSAIDELLANNRAVAASLPVRHLDVRPRRRLAIITCMDSRLDVFNALGLGEGEVHILRNAGGVITDDEIRSLAISQNLLGTKEIILIHHTDCGMLTFTDDQFKQQLKESTGEEPSWSAEAFSDLDQDVRDSIERIKSSPFIPHKDGIRGFVYEVESGKLREVS